MEATEIKEATDKQPQTQTQPQSTQIPEKLNQQQALQVLVDAARISQSKGIFSLEDAELVSKAIKAFMPPQEEGPVPTYA